MDKKEILSALIQEKLSYLEDPEKRLEGTDNLVVSKPLSEKARINIQSARTADELLQRSLNALRLSRVQNRIYLR